MVEQAEPLGLAALDTEGVEREADRLEPRTVNPGARSACGCSGG